MTKQELVNYLKECGVCEVCQLRYLHARGTEYRDRKEYFEKLNVKYDADDEPDNKKTRLEYCPTCLGLFSTEFQKHLVQGILAAQIEMFDCENIVVAISMPINLQLRQLSMWFALKQKFGASIDTERAPDVPLKEATKLILNPVLCEQLDKSYDANGLMININLKHADDAAEIDSLKELNNVAIPSVKGKRPVVSRGLLERQYTPARISAKLYEEYLPIPPKVPTECLSLESVSLTGPTVFVAGRYRKLSRQLSHTPWVLAGKRVMEDSIEEIIIRSVGPFFGKITGKIVFMSSGREDVDVRCLGAGRPFVLEIPDALRTKLPKEKAFEMEKEIDKSDKVSVRDLQMVQRDELVHIKTGEEKKRKFYRALCRLEKPASVDILGKLNLPNGFEIQQKTPIRVLHRRPLHTRQRSIYSLDAQVYKDDLRVLVVNIVSQAGTYIKELVHGEFGRTTPSLASLIGKPIDIIALDVVGIDLDWPPAVDNSC